MTSASVNDVSTVMQGKQLMRDFGTQAVKSGGFTEVFNLKTSSEKTKQPVSEEINKKPVRTKEDVKDETEVSDVKVPEKESVGKDNTIDTDKPDEKDLERAMESINTAAARIITSLSEILAVSEDTVMGVMEEMGLKPQELLTSEMLSQLFLQMEGTPDSMELLTNESLYNDFQTMMGTLEGILEETAKELGLNPEELKQLVEETSQSVILPKEPVFEEVTVTLQEAEVIEASDESQQAMRPVIPEEGNLVDEQQNPVAGSLQREQETGSKQEDSGESNKENYNENLILSQVRENSYKSGTQQTAPAMSESFASQMETRDIMRQIMDYMKVQMKPDMTNVEMQLHPASLGTLQVQVASKGGVLTAQFITQNETVKAALESQMISLQESLAQQGVKVEAIEVTVQTQQFESNLEQGRGSNQEAPERRNRTRRLQVDGELTAEALEGMDAENILAAQILQASGGTIDYTA